MQIKIRGFIMAKKGEQYTDCRDNYAWSQDHHRFALSDGVSRSFFPGIWSELLVTGFVNASSDISTIIPARQQAWQDQVKVIVEAPDVKYYTRNAFNRKTPGMATFIGLTLFEKEQTWQAVALGDSYLFFVPKSVSDFTAGLIVHSSKDDPAVFDNYPDYFSSIGDQNGHLKEINGALQFGTFYMMSDALAEWFLRKGETVSGIIQVWGDQTHFERYIEDLREQDAIQNDDTSILIIELSDDGHEHFSYEEATVSDLKALIAQQTKQAIHQVVAQAVIVPSTEEKEDTTVVPVSMDPAEPTTPVSDSQDDAGEEPTKL
jgi:hypothetical protein